jgi:hypothetical protein
MMQRLTTRAHRIGLKGSALIQLLISGLISAAGIPPWQRSTVGRHW